MLFALESPSSVEMRRTRSKKTTQPIIMCWIFLVLAGLCETFWSVSLKCSNGFTRLVPSIFVGMGLIGSMLLFSLALRSVPMGTAYPVWVGVGVCGATVIGAVLFKEPLSPARLFFLALLITAIIGLKLTSGGSNSAS